MAVAVLFSALDTGYRLVKDIAPPPILPMDVNESLDTLG
jgi:hypothetical protein